MEININQTIRNVLKEDRTLKSTQTTESYMIIPAPGKHLVNTKTGESFVGALSLGSRWKVSDFIEVSDN